MGTLVNLGLAIILGDERLAAARRRLVKIHCQWANEEPIEVRVWASPKVMVSIYSVNVRPKSTNLKNRGTGKFLEVNLFATPT